MAEERLIDTDKDKKYRIETDEDGEEQLVVSDSGEETVAEPEEAAADIDGGDEAVMTPEQLAAKREREEAERAERQQKVDGLLEKAKSESRLYRYVTALEYLAEAEELDGENGELHALKLCAYTRDFTDYSQIVAAAECADDVAKYTPKERKDGMLALGGESLETEIARLRASVTSMKAENDKNKAERAVKFKRDRNIALIAFACVLAVLGVFVGLAAYFSTIIYTVSTGKYLIMTCVFAALAVVMLVALAFVARQLNIHCRRLRLNKRNNTTQLGRDLLNAQAQLKALLAVQAAIKE